jgi:TrmH family RNA methyltransferase
LEAQRGEVGVVFGREQSGLSNVELDICHAMVSIPCNPLYSSLNLAAALQIVCYELLLAREDPRAKAAIDDVPIKGDIPAEIEQVEQYYEHLERTLITLGFLNPHHPKHLMRRLRRLFNRSRLSWKEIKILRGILTSVEKRMLRQGPF